MRKIIVVLIGIILISLVLVGGCTEKKPINDSEKDIDDDGYNDAVDAFPADRTEWADSDGDGVGDNADAFPTDPTESVDSDGDGVGDNADYYPEDPTRWEQPSSDVFLKFVEPFLLKLDLQDSELQSYANTILTGCDASNTECFVNALYRDVLMNYTCLDAPMNNVTLQTPQETIQKKEGTCEDLSILLCSLLSNIGLTSHLVFTNTHVYAMVSDINADDLWHVAEQSLIHHVEDLFGEAMFQEYHVTQPVNTGESMNAVGDRNKTFDGLIDYMSIDYSFHSDQPLILFVMPSGDFANVSPIPEWTQTNVTDATGTIPQLFTFGGIVLYNGGMLSATVTLDITFSFQASFYKTYNKDKLTVYGVWGKDAVLLDPTLGDFGFPGYDAVVVGVKKVFDPLTNHYVTLS